MRMRFTSLFVLTTLTALPFAITSCGGIADTPSEPPGSNDGGTDAPHPPTNDAQADAPHDAPSDALADALPPPPIPVDFEGSYELSFSAIHETPQEGEPNTDPPSAGATMRLDLHKTASGDLEAIVTAAFGDPARFAVAVDATSLTLSGKGADVEAGGATDTWTTLRLDRASNGDLAGSFSSVGQEMVVSGDEIFSSDLTGAGTVAHDTHGPTFVTAPPPVYGPPNAFLPWDSIAVRASEPIDPASFVFTLQGAPDPGGVTWTVAANKDVTTSWVGRMVTSGSIPTYDGLGLVHVVAAHPIADRAGNTGTFSGVVSFANVPPPQAAFTFDDAAKALTWGDVTLLPSGDAHCESGGCARLVTSTACLSTSIGLAGRLNATSGASIDARVRVLVKTGGNGWSPFFAPLVLRAAGKVAGLDTVDIKKLATPDGPYDMASDWTTLSVALTPGADVGFSLANEAFCTGGSPDFDVAYYIDAITVHP